MFKTFAEDNMRPQCEYVRLREYPLRVCKLPLPCRVIQKQMAFMLGRHGMFLELNEDVEDYEDLTEIMSNVQLNSNFLALAREVRDLWTLEIKFIHLVLRQIRNLLNTKFSLEV